MNQVICIAYRPGAFGSFIAWATERFSLVRRRYQPPVMDDPLLPDGSSHAYASFCKIKSEDDFMQGLNTARWDINPWHTKVFAGWPVGDINHAVTEIQTWMMAFDKLIIVECEDADDHYICYLRNESTMDRDRWYDMLNIQEDAQLIDALRQDVNSPTLSQNHRYDPRILYLSVNKILNWSPDQLGHALKTAMAWPTCDHDLFRLVTSEMQNRQVQYLNRLSRIKNGSAETPAERAILQSYIERTQDGSK
jgi:hypothetical protein